MRSTPEIDTRLTARLRQAVDQFAGGSADRFGRAIGYTNGGYVREILNGKKPVREALIQRIHEHKDMRGWFDGCLPTSIIAPLPQEKSAQDQAVLDALRDLPLKQRRAFIDRLMAEAAMFREHRRSVLDEVAAVESSAATSSKRKAA